MKINKTELQTALELIKPGLANKEMIEQSTSFVFTKGKIVTYNDLISISHPVKGLENLEGAIQAEELYHLVSRMKSEEVEIIQEGSELIFSAGRVKAGISLQAEIKLPLDSLNPPNKWKDLPDEFLLLIRMAIGVCSKDMSNPSLTGIHVADTGIIESTDRYKIIRGTMKKGLGIPSFILGASSAKEVLKLKVIKIAESIGWIHFKTEENTVLSCRTINASFPDLTPFLSPNRGIKVGFPKTMVEMLDRAYVFAKRDYFLDEWVEIKIANNRVKVRANSPTGWIEEEANVKYSDSPITFLITPYLLKDILLQTQTCSISEKSVVFEGGNWKYLAILRETPQK